MSEMKFNEDLLQDINWEVAKRPVSDFETGTVIPGYKRLVKQDGSPIDQQETFHIAKDSYNPPSISEFKGYVGQLADITGYQPVGYQEWGGGKKVFGYLKNTGEKFDIDGHDIEDYMLVGVGFGGQTAFFVGSVNRLLRCTNEFGNINRTWKIRNTTGRQLKMEELLSSFDEHMKKRDLMFDAFRRFKEVNIDQNLINAAKRRLLDIDQEDKLADLSGYKQNRYAELSAALNSETLELGNNLWGLFNGVTYYTTHDLKKEDSSKNIFGNVAGEKRHQLNKGAFDFCSEVLKERTGVELVL
jgi:hypothetical protein